MNTTPLVRRARGFLIATVGLILAGYASSAISTRQCERHAANNLASELGDRNVFVLPEGIGAPFYPGALEILQRAGFAARPCVTSGRNFDCFPWAGVAAADVIGPFVVDVRWGYIAGPTIGNGHRTRYLVVFGAVFPLEDFGDWDFAV